VADSEYGIRVSGGEKCSTHCTPKHEIEAAVLRNIQAVLAFARFEPRFYKSEALSLALLGALALD
jgi:hypothetical protein